MARLVSTVIITSIVAAQLFGCHTKGVDKKVVEQALSGKAGANIPQDRVRDAGEQAIPLIFDEVRDTPDEMIPYRASLLVDGMTAMHTADRSAPYIRKVLADRQEPERIRVLAAEMLGFYWESPEPQRALIEHAKHDTSEAVRVQCIVSLGGLTLSKLPRSNGCIVDQQVQQVFAEAMKDKSTKIREQTCDSVAVVGSEALYEGVELAWCRQLLIQGKHDKEYVVRKAAVDGLFVLESIRQKNRR